MRVFFYITGAALFSLILLITFYGFIYCIVLGKYYEVITRLQAYQFKVKYMRDFRVMEKRIMDAAIAASPLSFQKQMEINDFLGQIKSVYNDDRFTKRIEVMELYLFMHSKIIKTDARQKSKGFTQSQSGSKDSKL